MADILIMRLEEEMKKQGFNYKSLSRAAGLGETSVRDIITRRAMNPRRDTLQKIATTLDKPLSYFLAEEQKVRLVGEIHAGSRLSVPPAFRVSEHKTSAGNVEMVEAPPEAGHRDLVALRVKGDILAPFLPSGTLVYYRESGDGREECLDHPCVIQIRNAAIVIRTLRRGMLYGTYSLQDYKGGLSENVDVEWCAKVRFIRLP